MGICGDLFFKKYMWRSDTNASTRGINQRSGKSKGLCKPSEFRRETNKTTQKGPPGHRIWPQLNLHTAAANCITSHHTFTSLTTPPPSPLIPHPSSPLPLPCTSPHILFQFPLWISSCRERHCHTTTHAQHDGKLPPALSCSSWKPTHQLVSFLFSLCTIFVAV